jgi:hypothetical protein
MPELETEWVPKAEWQVEFFHKVQMEVIRIKEIYAPSEGIALLFAFRHATAEGFNTAELKHLKTERVN